MHDHFVFDVVLELVLLLPHQSLQPLPLPLVEPPLECWRLRVEELPIDANLVSEGAQAAVEVAVLGLAASRVDSLAHVLGQRPVSVILIALPSILVNFTGRS